MVSSGVTRAWRRKAVRSDCEPGITRAKQIRIVTLRELTAEDFAGALVEGIRSNHTEEPAKARIEAFETTMLALKTAAKGARVIQIDWPAGERHASRL